MQFSRDIRSLRRSRGRTRYAALSIFRLTREDSPFLRMRISSNQRATSENLATGALSILYIFRLIANRVVETRSCVFPRCGNAVEQSRIIRAHPRSSLPAGCERSVSTLVASCVSAEAFRRRRNKRKKHQGAPRSLCTVPIYSCRTDPPRNVSNDTRTNVSEMKPLPQIFAYLYVFLLFVFKITSNLIRFSP